MRRRWGKSEGGCSKTEALRRVSFFQREKVPAAWADEGIGAFRVKTVTLISQLR
jgi:hypothetical protein